MRNTTRWSRVKQEYLLTAVMGGASNITAPDINDVNTWSWSRLVNTKDVSNRILTNQTNITSTFNTGSIGHDVSAGVEFTRENQTNYGVNAMTAPAVNLYHPVSNLSIGGLDRNGANANGQTDTFGIYAFDTLTLTERIEVNGGLRLDNYHTKYDSATACGGSGRGAIACPPGQSTGSPVTTVDTAKSGNLVNWKAGALYRLTEQGNVYVNYAISQQPPGAAVSPWPPAVAATAPTEPTLSHRRRNPASWAPSGKSSTTVCCSARRYSVPILKTKWPPTMTEPGRSTAKSAWRGYELSATGNLTPDWTIIAGYTQQHATVTEGQNVAQDGSSALAYTPKHAFTLWTQYQATSDLSVGGGVRYVGSLRRGSDGAVGTPDHTEGYWVADAKLGYRVNSNLDLQLNMYNLFDTDYVASINKSGYRYHPGEPRTFMLTANVHF